MFLRQLDVVADAANVARTRFAGPRISEVRGKIGNLRAQPIFTNKTAGRERVKPGPGPQLSVLPLTSESTCRKYAANSGTFEHAAFLTKETAGRSVVAFRYAQHSGILPHTSDFFSIPFGYLPIKPCLPLGLR